MALADGCTNCLAGLLPCAILHCDVLIWGRPSMLLKASSLEDTLIGKDEVAAILDDLVDLLPQLNRQVGVLLIELVLLLRHVLSLHLLELEAVKLQDLAEMFRLDDAIGKLPMEQLASLGEAQVRLHVHVVRIKEIV